MSKPHSPLARHVLLASCATAGMMALFLPLSAARAETPPASPPAAPTLDRPSAESNGGMAVAPASASGADAAQPEGDATIRPFKSRASDEALVDLKRRVLATKWPSKELVNDASQGVQLATMQKLSEYWANQYDWRKFEARLNAFPQFMTNIDGVDIHFIHVRSKHPSALPIIITHGWPGSIVEMLKIIGPLTNPTAHGGNAADAFHVVIPSMPGYGFSGKPTELGWEPVRIARAWVELMDRLGYAKYVTQGGDWGDPISSQVAVLAPTRVLAVHSNMPGAVPPEILKAAQAGAPPPSDLTADERKAYDQLSFFFQKGLSYALQMAGRPQTLYALDDSPVGLAAWLLDHDARSYALISRAFDGGSEGLTRDDVLDNVTLYWLTNTGVSSSRLYWENKLPFFAPIGLKTPVAVSAFPDELYQTPRSWAEKAFPNLLYYNRLEKGGHFAAWEQPEIFVKELRAGFKTVR